MSGVLRAFALLGVVFFIPGLSLAQTAPAAAPLPSASPSCAVPHKPATVVNAVAPDYPDDARGLGLAPTSVILSLEIDARGKVVSVETLESSGFFSIDIAAVKAARESTFAPATENCANADGWYIFWAQFNPGSVALKRTARFRCMRANSDAGVIRVGEVRWPDGSHPSSDVRAVVKVTLTAYGVVRDAIIDRSTGIEKLDHAALDSAWRTIFAPACADAKPVESTFGYEVDFDPNAPTPSPSATP